MSKLVIPLAEVQGVDLKTNPLLLGTRKLRFTTNLVFDEGVLKTRPGLVHSPIGVTGQFQGACSYRPSQGISSASFAEESERLILAVDGKVWAYCNCNLVAITPSDPFHCQGDVTLFQAENYLVMQNPATSTYWWDGGTLTESPGLIEQHWDEPGVPEVALEDAVPVANIPECYPTSTYTLTFRVLDKVTELPIPGSTVVLKRWSTPKYRGVTGAGGTSAWVEPMKKELRYFVSKDGYLPVNDIPFTVTGVDQEVIVHLEQPPLACGYYVSLVSTDLTRTVGTIVVTNNGSADLNILYLKTLVDGTPMAGEWSVGASPVTTPITVAAGTSKTLVFAAIVTGALDGAYLTLYTSCPASDSIPFPWITPYTLIYAPIPGP